MFIISYWVIVVEDIKTSAREYAKNIGLPLFGVAPPDALYHLESLLNTRKQTGMESPFEKKWSAKARCRPELVFPDVRSIICVGMPYYRPLETDPPEEPRWRISRFAWGKDYHVVLREKLEKLAAFLLREIGPGFKYFACVDTIPLVERSLAYAAGLGWFGKNNLLINQDYGSWFVLGELLTNAALPFDSPIEGDCGSCDACIRACPTRALVMPYDLDTNKCISCINQNTKPVFMELRSQAGRSVFGCDICQEVCPKNKELLHDGGWNATPYIFSGEDLVGILNMTEEEFIEKYGSTAFAWGGRELLQRNTVIALGRTGSKKYILPLANALLNSTPQVRCHAAWALGKIGSRDAGLILLQAWRREEDENVRKEIGLALTELLRSNKLD